MRIWVCCFSTPFPPVHDGVSQSYYSHISLREVKENIFFLDPAIIWASALYLFLLNIIIGKPSGSHAPSGNGFCIDSQSPQQLKKKIKE
jgi:hypothetical protein